MGFRAGSSQFHRWRLEKRAGEDDHVEAVADKFSTPTYTRDFTEMLHPLLDKADVSGILHLTNAGSCSWQEYAQWALDCAGAAGIPLKAQTVDAISLKDIEKLYCQAAIYSALSTEKYRRLTEKSPRDWRDAVFEYVQVQTKL